MKRLVTLCMVLVLLFSFPLTANAAKSPSGGTVTEEGKDTVSSPKTGESDAVVYVLGTTAVVLASGAVLIRKKAIA